MSKLRITWYVHDSEVFPSVLFRDMYAVLEQGTLDQLRGFWGEPSTDPDGQEFRSFLYWHWGHTTFVPAATANERALQRLVVDDPPPDALPGSRGLEGRLAASIGAIRTLLGERQEEAVAGEVSVLMIDDTGLVEIR